MRNLNNRGQAATEFVIAAVFILIPLFFIIPLLGKYIDIRHATVQQARYEAWEYTVWAGPKEKTKYGHKEEQFVGAKKYDDVREEGRLLFFTDPFQKKYGTAQQMKGLNPLWVDHRGETLFVPGSRQQGVSKESQSPDPTGGVANTIFTAFNWIYKIFGRVLTFFRVGATFDAVYNRGYYSTELQVKVRSPEQIVPLLQLDGVQTTEGKPLLFQGRAAVQSNFWNSGSAEMATKQSKGLVFSAILSPVTNVVNNILNVLQKSLDVISKVLPVKVKLPQLPDFGYVHEDLVPYEHLESVAKDGSGAKTLPSLHEAGGLYYYKVKDKKDKKSGGK